jgi:hypothetical protein
VVKSQTAFAEYVGGVWYGSLDVMEPGKGYKLRLAGAVDTSFGYPDYESSPPPPLVLATAGESDVQASENAPVWSVNPHTYQYNMTVTAVLLIDERESIDERDLIGAFVGDECRGTAQPVYIGSNKRYVAFLMVHSNEVGGEMASFKLYDADADAVYDVNESMAYESDAIMGTVMDPFVFNAESEPVDPAQTLPKVFGLGQNYPNPFNPSTIISYDVPQGGGDVTLRIYDVTGRLVRTLINGFETAGWKTITWYGRNDRGQSVATGVYFYRMTAPGFEKTHKMVLMK